MDSLSQLHLVRVGTMGEIGRFRSLDACVFPRHSRVILRTARGVEVGEVIATPEVFQASYDVEPHEQANGIPSSHGSILRGMTVEDDLLASRLERNRDAAFEACSELLSNQPTEAILIDVELIFDGQGLYFYFLGEVAPEIETQINALAEQYDAVAKLSQFADTLSAGCGPDCGTKEGECGDGGCSTCSIAKACGARA